jgi:3-hydroxy-9,10-secoandrosta-1,3,5(10)-triene-9,17-dione monooxygenase reductase component
VAVDDGRRRIGTDPFLTPDADKDPARRLRGRLAAGTTVWTTSGGTGEPVGITVSSLLVAEGQPPEVVGLLGPLSDFWDAVQVTKRFVVHVLGADQADLAERFALRYPGDPFEGLAVVTAAAGPVLDAVGWRAHCRLAGYLEVGYSLLVRATIDEVSVTGDDVGPLVHYRGRYLTVSRRRS